MSRVEVLEDNVLVLTDVVPIDGRVSWVTPRSAGFEPYNEYLLISDARALLIDTGVALHGPSLTATLKDLVGSRQLAVFVTRSELDSVGNLAAIIEAFPDVVVGTTNPLSPLGLIHMSDGARPRAPLTTFRFGDTLAPFGFPTVRLIDPVIKSLGTTWLLDEPSQTLFTADFFCDDMLAGPADSVLRNAGEPLIAPEGLRASILQKFDWLNLASTGRLEAAWDGLFGRISPASLAPVHGRVQVGPHLVGETLKSYREALFEVPVPRR